MANIVYKAVSKFHPFSEPLILLSKECKEPRAYPRGTWGKSQDTKASQKGAHKHTHTHYGHFRDVSQPTTRAWRKPQRCDTNILTVTPLCPLYRCIIHYTPIQATEECLFPTPCFTKVYFLPCYSYNLAYKRYLADLLIMNNEQRQIHQH